MKVIDILKFQQMQIMENRLLNTFHHAIRWIFLGRFEIHIGTQ